MSSDKPIKGTQKVAAFLLSLDKAVATEVMRHLEPSVLSDVAAAMTELDAELADPQAVSDLRLGLARDFNSRRGVRSQDDDELAMILEASFGAERSGEILAEIHARREIDRPFAFLEEEAPERAVQLLVSEPTSVIALVLAHVAPSLSATVLAALENDDALDVVKRMTTLVPPGAEAMRAFARSIADKLAALSRMPAPPDPKASLKTIAEMLNHTNQEVEQSVLEGIESEDEEVAAGIRDFMFTWNDIAEVDKRSMQKILATVDTRTLAIALKACPQDVEDNVIQNLSSRVQDMVLEERELAGALPMDEVLAARALMLKGVRSLMDSGEFRPARSGEELVS